MIFNEKAQTAVDAAEGQMGAPYVFGAWGELCTPGTRKKYLGYNPDKTGIKNNCQVLLGDNAACDGCKYQGKNCYDCRGFTRWTLRQAGLDLTGAGATSQWNDGNNWWQRGAIADLPDVVCCLFQQDGQTMKHTGMHVGGGRIIHCTGNPGEVKTSWLANEKAWTHYAIPNGLYTADEIIHAEKVKELLMRGDSGEEVRQLQTTLNNLGYDCGTVDGKFGSKTEAALKAFQKANGLPETGTVDDRTAAVLKAYTNKPGISEPVPGLGSAVDQVKLSLAMQEAVKCLYDAGDVMEDAVQRLRNAASALEEVRLTMEGANADG